MNWSEPWSGASGEDPARTRRAVLGGVGAGAAALLAGCTVAGQGERETEPVAFSVPGEDVDSVAVAGDDGRTTVRGWDGSTVRVEATKYARGATDLDDVRVTRAVTGGRLDIAAERPAGFSLGPSGGGLEALDVRVPAGTRVARVDVDDGTGTVTDVEGDIDVSVDDGSLDVGPVDGHLSVSVDDGTVTAGRVDSLSGEVDDGTVEMTEPATIGDFHADDGSLGLVANDLEDGATVRSEDGDVTAALAPTVDATVVVTTDDADVQIDSGLFDDATTGAGTTRGEVGDGSARLTVEMDDGTVQMRPL
jgi:hypothetical protein